jgi:superfamily II DNA/RNA helicase
MAAIPQESRNSGFYVQHFDKGDNETSIKGQVLCGVPDKICQLVQKNIINLGNVRYIVVDEADNTIMNDKNSLVLRVVKSLITTGNMNWKMIVCGATIEMNQLKSRFHEALLNAPGVKETPNFFDFKYFHYEIVLDNIYHFYVPTAVKSDMERVLIEVITQTLTAFDLSQIMVFFN